MAATSTDILGTLRELHRDKLALRERHVAVARHIDHYEFNNTYQYAINREDVHLSWLETAIAELGGTPDDVPAMDLPSPGGKSKPGQRPAFTSLVEEDVRSAEALVAKWRPRVASFENVRHAKMVDVILGETLEHKRFFAQIAQGNDVLLGTRMPGASTGHGVMGVRWIE